MNFKHEINDPEILKRFEFNNPLPVFLELGVPIKLEEARTPFTERKFVKGEVVLTRFIDRVVGVQNDSGIWVCQQTSQIVEVRQEFTIFGSDGFHTLTPFDDFAANFHAARAATLEQALRLLFQVRKDFANSLWETP